VGTITTGEVWVRVREEKAEEKVTVKGLIERVTKEEMVIEEGGESEEKG
jgi:hypothetical protein